MLQAFLNVFRIVELRSKVLFTLGMLAVFRIGHWIPLPGINQEKLAETFQQQSGDSWLARLTGALQLFGGGAFDQSTIFALGVMPYISASIIFQLLGQVVPSIKAIQNEGPSGRQRVMEWTRYATIALCLIQGTGILMSANSLQMVYPEWAANPLWWVVAVLALTAGTMFLMWLGEQIDKHGIGNGVSLIIAAGILSRMPQAVVWIIKNFDPSQSKPGSIGIPGVLCLIAGFVLVIAGSVIMTKAQRRIPIQQAKHTRGRKVFGGQKSYLPLRVNHGGVMPVIFASSLMMFPSVIFSAISDQARAAFPDSSWTSVARWFADEFGNGQFIYIICEIVLIYFFSYFWITVQFNPEEMSKQLRDHGSFIPGLRPGPRTAEYLEAVMERITFVGAAFLALIATAPVIVQSAFGVPFEVSQFLGGTGLLIVVSVVLDFIQRIEANLLMRNYAGFLGDDASARGATTA